VSHKGDSPSFAGSDDPSVRLEQVSKQFGDLVAVDKLTLSFGRGRFFTLLGPSGCGKTTTLRMVGSTVTFPLFLWGAARVATPPQINVIASMIFFATLSIMLLTVWQQRRAERLAEVRPDPV
jgi:ABC-type uncharacterized transport system fused permease/ATPase subunit